MNVPITSSSLNLLHWSRIKELCCDWLKDFFLPHALSTWNSYLEFALAWYDCMTREYFKNIKKTVKTRSLGSKQLPFDHNKKVFLEKIVQTFIVFAIPQLKKYKWKFPFELVKLLSPNLFNFRSLSWVLHNQY